MNRRVMLGFILAFLMLPFSTLSVKASSQTIIVPDDYPTIQEAIDAAPEGSTVFVKSGTYLNQSLVVNKPLSLIGENSETTIIQGKGDAYPVYESSASLNHGLEITFLEYKTTPLNFLRPPRVEVAIKLASNDVTISGFTIGNCNRGISGTGDRTKIIDNNITANGESCIDLHGSYMTIANNSLFPHGDAAGIGFTGLHTNVTGNKISGASIGITFLGEFNFISENNIFDNTGFGIQVLGNSSIICRNNITDGRMGLALVSCSGSTFVGNNITKQTERAMYMDSSNSNIFQANYIGSNQGYTVYLGSTNVNNKFYENIFINNTKKVQFAFNNQSNSWDNDKEGNYWSDYTGIDANHDRIGDTPYVINEKNTDNFPLMSPVSAQEITLPSPAPTETATPAPSPTPTTTPPNSELFPTSQVVAISASATVAAIGFLFYFKKSSIRRQRL